MNTNRRIQWLTLIALARVLIVSLKIASAPESPACFQTSHPVQPAARVEDIIRALVALKSHEFKEHLSPDEIDRAQRTATMVCDTSDSWDAIIQLWIAGEDHFVELTWWRKDDSETRAMIVALEWCAVDPPPRFDSLEWNGVVDYEGMSNRFNAQERSLRLAETDLVQRHHRELRGPHLRNPFGKPRQNGRLV